MYCFENLKRENSFRAAGTVSNRELFIIWSRACRKDVTAQRQLYQLLLKYPQIEVLLKNFATERTAAKRAYEKSLGVKTKKRKPTGNWGDLPAKANRYVVIVGGGLPTLGKKR
jgi:hypothetical protein